MAGKSAGNAGFYIYHQEGSPRAKGGAMEFDFRRKINRIAFQRLSISSKTAGTSEIEAAELILFLAKLH
jgi:hypothetical protein